MMKSTSLLTLLLFLVFPACLLAGEIPEEKREAIKELMEVTGAGQIGDQISQLFTTQMIQALKSNYPDASEKSLDVIRREIVTVIDEELSKGTLEQQIYPIYAEHFTVEEIRGLIVFNNSALGRKANQLMPQLIQESSRATQNWGKNLRDKLTERVSAKLKQEGIEMAQ